MIKFKRKLFLKGIKLDIEKAKATFGEGERT
jgi:hypothetical protein